MNIHDEYLLKCQKCVEPNDFHIHFTEENVVSSLDTFWKLIFIFLKDLIKYLLDKKIVNDDLNLKLECHKTRLRDILIRKIMLVNL